jgi:ribosomal protein L7/L12
VKALAREGKKVEAINTYRKKTGADSDEAKEAIEYLIQHGPDA